MPSAMNDPKVFEALHARFEVLMGEAADLWIAEVRETLGSEVSQTTPREAVIEKARGALLGVMLGGLLRAGTTVDELVTLIHTAADIVATAKTDPPPPNVGAVPT